MKKALISLFLLVFAVAAFAGPQFSNDTFRVTFDTAVTAGGVQLPAGIYQARHVMEGQEHVLVFTLVQGLDKHNVERREFRVKCRMQPLQARADRTLKYFSQLPSGQRELTALVFEGDTSKHVF